MRCPVCQQPNPASARFCSECGVSLARAAQAAAAPAEVAYAPAAYTPYQTEPQAMPYNSSPEMYQSGAPANAYAAHGYAPMAAPYGYAPAAAAAPHGYGPPLVAGVGGPSLVNSFTVNQVAPTPSTKVPRVKSARSHGSLTRLLSTLYFLATGIVVGIGWVAATQTQESGGWPVVMAVITVVAFILDYLIVDRLTR